MNTTYGVCSDAHLHNWSAFSSADKDGVNNRLNHIIAQIYLAAKNTHAEGGDRLYIAGDLFHVRGSVSPTVLNPTIDLFNRIHKEFGIETRILTGNHDLESRDSEALSSACESLRTVKGVTVVSQPQAFHDDKVIMIPWFDSMDRVREEIQWAIDCFGPDVSEYTLIIHAPVNGVIIGIPDHGFWAAELAKHGFKRVLCGHYHNFKEFPGNVFSVGACTHQTWNDVGTIAGHLVFKDKTYAHYESVAPKFIDYDLSWDVATAVSRVACNYVRIRLGSATDEEVTMIRDHVMALDAAGCIVQAIPTPKTAATARTSSVSSAPTVRESISEWIKSNSSGGESVEKLCQAIIDEVEAVDL